MGDFDAAGVFQARSEDEMIQQSLVALEEYRRTGRRATSDVVRLLADDKKTIDLTIVAQIQTGV